MNIVNYVLKKSVRVMKSAKVQKGFSLIEVLIAIAVLGVSAAAFLGAISTAIKTQIAVDEKETAKNLAESQMEYVKTLAFAPTYIPEAVPPAYDGYSASLDVGNITSRDGNIQKITVTISHQGKELLQLEDFKVK